MAAENTNNHSQAHSEHHDHHQRHGHHHEHHDPGAFYAQPWVQTQLRQLDAWCKENAEWIGIQPEKPQRVLDYACGNGTVTKALLPISYESTTFQGLESSPSQVTRFNSEAKRLEIREDRMYARVGDFSSPSNSSSTSANLNSPEWKSFDVAITSMALHHFAEPVEMLSALRERVIKETGVVVVLDHCPLSLLSAEREVEEEEEEREEEEGGDSSLDPSSRFSVHGEKVWTGFTPRKLRALMRAAGLRNAETKVYHSPAWVPKVISGGTFDLKALDEQREWMETRFILARGFA